MIGEIKSRRLKLSLHAHAHTEHRKGEVRILNWCYNEVVDKSQSTDRSDKVK